MKSISLIKQFAVLLLALANPAMADELQKNFITPPDDARPWVFWFTMSGNMSKESITADLESMARVGIGGAIRIEVGQPGSPTGPVAYNGPVWHELFTHTCKEAARLGMEINMTNSPSWAGSGGPWITPEFSMKNITWTETIIEGGKKVEVMLPQPKAVMDYYRDFAVVAMPAPEGEGKKLSDYGAVLTSSGTEVNPGCFKLSKPDGKRPQYIQIEFPHPYTARWIKCIPSTRFFRGNLQFSNDGITFKPVRGVLFEKSTMELPFSAVTARFFRLEITQCGDVKDEFVEISELNLGTSYRIEEFFGKAAFTSQRLPPMSATFKTAPESHTIAHDQIKDVTASMDASGKLTWDAPSGRWLILRMGATPKGQINFPAPDGGRGLECDKLSKEAATVAFNSLVGKLVAKNKALTGQGKTLVATHIDSWECNGHNWTPKLREEFKQRRGYDLWNYLPVFTGRVVDNVEISERLLWDLRQTLSDMLVENYAGTFRRLANQNGLRLTIEAYGAGCPADDIAYGAQADEPMGEFWSWHKLMDEMQFSSSQMASIAHTYGKKIVGAEALTARREERWQGHPANLKDMADWGFCEGINRMVIHRFAAQRFEHVAPGLGMGFWGLHYERTQTWWEQSKPWHDYLARCQYLLRQGKFVADVLYLQNEGAPYRFYAPADAVAAKNIRGGYNFDACSIDVLMNRLSVKDGKLVLPDGMSYRVLVVPPTQTMTLRVLRRLKELADQGATIIADAKPPVKSPSLVDYGAGDTTISKLTAELWPKLVTGKTASQLLGERGIKPDFSATPLLRYIHRATDDADLYFVANPEQVTANAVAEFRISGKQPELWWPDTGRIELAKEFEIQDGVTRIPLRLDPSGSVFVIFRQSPVATKAGGKNWIETTPVQEIVGPWTVRFDPKWGGPAQPVKFEKLQDWSASADSGIKYYSGQAIYQAKFQANKGKCILDLGNVEVMAEVILNGRSLGILWKPPYCIDVSDAMKDGENNLEIKVVNLWINRLIGDEQLPEDSVRNPDGALVAWPQWLLDGKPSPAGRFTFCTTRLWKKDDPLAPSGLIGPVMLHAVK